ncbi:hypothetical protein J5N97_004410 [Dioscorea zingiberensis]|uniref:Embryonic flower 1 n=1 Tax=Dioscorea zingiberensis TaxID=325984 RepID=A0A9D5D782_9LILI|nr:hypothetical protein J5N97_004410 [Dioscorea zingiberensis]
MEVSYVEDLNCGTKSPGFAPQPVASRIELKSINLTGADDEQEPNKCEHFTIRGYVAEVRKRDAKIGWPLSIQKYLPDQQAYSLPPLSVTSFRWWNCQNCLRNPLSSETAIPNGVFTSIANGEGKHHILSSEANDNVVPHPSGLQKLSTGKSSEERSTEAGRSSTVSSSEFNPSLLYGKKENESLSAYLSKEGFVLSNGGCHKSQGNQNLLRKPTFVQTEGEIRQPVETGLIKQVLCTQGSETVYHGEDVPSMIDTKTKANELTYGISGCEMSGVIPISYRDNIAAPAKKNSHVLVGLADLKEPYDGTVIKCVMQPDAISPSHVSDDCRASNVDERLVHNMNETENDASQSTSNPNSQHKKARKVRLLNDIIKSEESRMADKGSDCDVDEKRNEIENSKGRRLDTLKRKEIHLHQNGHYAAKKTRVKPTMDHYGSKSHQHEDDGPSLMHWLQKFCKKSLKGDKETDRNRNEVGVSNISGDASSVACHVESCGMRREQKIIVDRKQAESVKSCQILQEQSVNGKNKMIAEDPLTKEYTTEAAPKTVGAGIFENNVQHCHEILNETLRNVMLKKKKKSKAPRGKDDNHFQKLRLKDAFGEHKEKTTESLKVKKKVTKKQNHMLECSHEAADDFPMDIVELLARNQHERHLLNPEVAAEKLHNLSEMAEKMKDCKFLDDFKDHGSKVSHQLDKNLPQRKSLSNRTEGDTQPPARVDLNVDHRKNDYHSLSNAEQGLFFASEVSTSVSQSSGHPITEGQLPVGTLSSCLPHKLYWNRLAVQTSQSCQKANAGTDQHSFRNTHYMPSVLINSSNPGLVTGKFNDDFNQANLYPFSEESLLTTADRADSQGTMNPIYACPHTRKKKDLESSIYRKTVQHAMSMFENPGDYHSELMMPLNKCTNDTTAAMHMLSLTDLAAYSREPLRSPVSLNPYSFHHESEFCCTDQYTELLGLPTGLKTITDKHPWINGNPDQDLLPGNTCKPIRPVPRIGVLGSLLHKEISTHSNSCREPFSLKDGHSSQLSSFKTNAKSKMDLQSTSHAKLVNSRTSTSREENSKHMVTSASVLTHPGCSLGTDTSSAEINSTDGTVQPLKSTYAATICVVNRNPADFAFPDEDSEYMIGNEELRPRDTLLSEGIRCSAHGDGLKQRKVMKLTALKEIMRS